MLISSIFLLLLIFHIRQATAASDFDIGPVSITYIRMNISDIGALLGPEENICRDQSGSLMSCQTLCLMHEECATFIYDSSHACSCRFTSLPFCVFRSPFRSYSGERMDNLAPKEPRELLLGIQPDRSSTQRLRQICSYHGFAPIFDNMTASIPVVQLLKDPAGRIAYFSNGNRTLPINSERVSCERLCENSRSHLGADCKFVVEVRRQIGHEISRTCYFYGSLALKSLITLKSADLFDIDNDRSVSSSVSFMPGTWNDSDNTCEQTEWSASVLSFADVMKKPNTSQELLIPSPAPRITPLSPEAAFRANVDEPNVLSDSYYPLDSLGLVHQILALVAILVFIAFSIGLCIFFCPYVTARRSHRNRHRHHVYYSQADPISNQSLRPHKHHHSIAPSMASSYHGHSTNPLPPSSVPSMTNLEKRSESMTNLEKRSEATDLPGSQHVVCISIPSSHR